MQHWITSLHPEPHYLGETEYLIGNKMYDIELPLCMYDNMFSPNVDPIGAPTRLCLTLNTDSPQNQMHQSMPEALLKKCLSPKESLRILNVCSLKFKCQRNAGGYSHFLLEAQQMYVILRNASLQDQMPQSMLESMASFLSEAQETCITLKHASIRYQLPQGTPEGVAFFCPRCVCDFAQCIRSRLNASGNAKGYVQMCTRLAGTVCDMVEYTVPRSNDS
jgi:hypothetical protein